MKKTLSVVLLLILLALIFGCVEEQGPSGEIEADVCINEFMASNDSGVIDENGETEDWIEIYNRVELANNEVVLENYYLTDEPDEPRKWRIPDTSIASFGFLFVWADDDGDQGCMHANFKLSASGEFLALYHDTDSGLVVVDSLTYPEQHPDTSYYRKGDGCDEWGYAGTPTPGLENE